MDRSVAVALSVVVFILLLTSSTSATSPTSIIIGMIVGALAGLVVLLSARAIRRRRHG